MARRETERDTYGGERRWAEGAGESWTAVEKTGRRSEAGGETDPESARWRGSEAGASPGPGTLRKITDELGITEPAAGQERSRTGVHESPSDERIREEVCEHLWRGAHVDVGEVSVAVNHGIVTLEGTVPNREMKHAIEDIAASCHGVHDIENRIRVTGRG